MTAQPNPLFDERMLPHLGKTDAAARYPAVRNRVLSFAGNEPPPSPVRAKALVFHDPRSLAVLDQVERVAASDVSVLIVGETGTGKELVARHIHECSQRSGPFVAVNCGAFSENLIEAELFGHEAGAYTGATQARAGWFESAQGGTLFLDEIGDLPLAFQVKLLRVLQERQVVRVGSRRAVPVDVRLVAATNVDLDAAVHAGRFRQDLYYRLNVAPVDLPPLRRRTGDILPLVDHFIERYRRGLGRDPVVLSLPAQAALLAHDWPGNIRELENVLHYALIVCQGREIQPADLRLRPSAAPLASAAAPTHSEPPLESALALLLASDTAAPFDATLKALIGVALDRYQGNQVHTARRLGITRNVLRTQMKRFGLLDGAPRSIDA